MAAWPPQTLFVAYCAGPHCNGAARAAARLSALGRPVKIMIGGITGWLDEGFPLIEGNGAARAKDSNFSQATAAGEA
jgi:rhodanese-related sulfurtransferase